MQEHAYQLNVKWTGNKGQGTADTRSFGRDHMIWTTGKPELLLSADPSFKGDASRWNPEELLLASLASCHMLSYLYLCAVNRVIVVEYTDLPTATMVVEATGTGHFTGAILHPTVVIKDAARAAEAEKLHEKAHHQCFIANSMNFPVFIQPVIKS